MYWTMRVLVPAYQAMCQYARVCVLGEKQKQDIFAILYIHTYIFIYCDVCVVRQGCVENEGAVAVCMLRGECFVRVFMLKLIV